VGLLLCIPTIEDKPFPCFPNASLDHPLVETGQVGGKIDPRTGFCQPFQHDLVVDENPHITQDARGSVMNGLNFSRGENGESRPRHDPPLRKSSRKGYLGYNEMREKQTQSDGWRSEPKWHTSSSATTSSISLRKIKRLHVNDSANLYRYIDRVKREHKETGEVCKDPVKVIWLV
jgi:hypothetical protein